MINKGFKGLLAAVLAVALIISLIPFGAVMTKTAADKAETVGLVDAGETVSEISSQKEVVNNTKPAPADGYIVKLLDESFADGLTCISADDGLYRAENKEQLKEIPDEALGYCEPDYKLSMLEDTSVNDTLYVNGAQWNLENMNVPAAWAKGQFGDGVTVAVIDSGLYGAANGESHEDIDPAKVVAPYNAISGGTNVSDDHGHGTFVAGMIIANTNNSAGIAGIMPNVKLMPIKVSAKDRDASISDVIKAIEYAVDNGADVINMSLGTNDFSEALKSACDNAVEKGVIVVAAAGNDGSSKPCYPAAYDSVIGVGSLTSDNLLAATSQYGESVYVTAPGAGVVSTDNVSNGYKRSSGTSFASPEAAALAAMAKSIDGTMDQDSFKKLLQDTCTDLGETGHDSLYGYGMLNFEKAANTLLGTDPETHKYGEWASDGASTHSRSCTDDGCTAKQTALHSWTTGTALTDGSTKYTCTVCGAERVSENSISGMWEYKLINNDNEVMLTKYIGDQTILVVPSSMDVNGTTLPVTALGNETFMGTDIFWLELPDSITAVEDGHQSTAGVTGACAFCKELTVVKLSAGMEKIADYMFYGAGSDYRLELTVPDGIKEVGISAFSLCNSITDLKLPESVEKIDNSAFYQSRRLKTLDIPGVKIIEADAFTETIFEENYENLWKSGEFEGIVYAGNVAYLYFGPYTGSGDKEYKPSVMPENTGLTLKNGTLGISEFCFTSHYVSSASCRQNLKAITVPNSLAYMPDGIFDGYSIEMNGFEKSYAESYAAEYDNIKFNPFSLPAKPSEDYDWYDETDGNVYEISTADELWGFADIVDIGEDDFSGKTVKLTNDIDLGGVTEIGYTISSNKWFPLSGFNGTFDGQGHSIKGVFIDHRSQNQVGFFSALTANAIIKNLNIEGIINGGDYVGAVVGKTANARIENCSFNGDINAGSEYGYIGGIAGFGSGTITGCKTYGSLNVRLSFVSDSLLNGASGGIVGYMTGPTTVISNCENNMNIVSNGLSLGGIAGQSMMMSKIEGCVNNGSISGYKQVGGVLGRLVVMGSGTPVNACTNNGSVYASDEDAGGIVGVTSGGDMHIVGCINNGSVEARINAAGILGHNSGVTVETSYNTGEIKAGSFAGGIIAKDSANGAVNCYNLGSISAGSWAGGISAYLDNAHGTEGRMTNCYNMGTVMATSGKADPLGSVYQDANIFENCYYLSTEKNETVENHIGLTRYAFTSGEVAYELGDAFGQKIGEDTHPVFRTDGNKVLFDGAAYYNEGSAPHEHNYVNGVCTICGAFEPTHEHSYSDWSSDGTDTHSRRCADCDYVETEPHAWNGGTVTKPATEDSEGERTYACTVCSAEKTEVIPKIERNERSIGTIEELQKFASEVDGGNTFKGWTITLAADIDATGIEWNPIGEFVKAAEYNAFAGTFDGCGHTVKIKAIDKEKSGVGFIAVNEGTIKNLTVEGTISGKSYVGGVVGYNLGTISGCTNKADVTAVSMTVGGITSYLKGGAKVEKCANLGAVNGNGTTYTGGVVGWAIANTYICECYNGGEISATKGYAGGIAGYSMGCSTNDCYNVGAVVLQASTGSVGGITGWFTGTVELKNCYSSGALSGGKYCGGIAGTAAETQLKNCYYLAGTADYASASKSFVGSYKSADEMKREEFAETLGAAFEADESNLNSGYPILSWQKAEHEHIYIDTVTAPTCTKKGYTTHTCACGDSYVDSYIDALGHNYGAWKQTKAPTCTAKGSESRICTRCNVSETRDIASLGHDLKHHEAKAATCTKKGWAAYDTCSRCDYTTYKEIPATGHHHNAVVTAPTCTAKGYTTHTCTACGNSYKDSYTNALGHDYKAGKCTRCGAADASYVAVPALKITTASGHPKLSWNAVDGAYKYWIYRSTDGKNFKYYDRTNNTSYTNISTTLGTTYYYKVKAVKAVDGKDVASDYSVVKSIQCRPAAVNISIYRVNGKPQLKWNAVDGATKYWIYRSTDGVNFKYYDMTTKTSYTNTGAASGTKYYYKVKAVAVVNGKNVASAYSNSKSLLTTLAAPSVSITTANGKPKVTWKAVTGADKYYIYRSTDGKNFSYYDTTTKTSYTNLSTKKNTKYFYKVKAVSAENSYANSAQSKAVSIKATK